MSSLAIEPDIGLRELLEVAASEEYSIQFSPMLRGPGGRQGGTFIRRAAPWKGLKKHPGEGVEEYFDRLAQVNEGVAEGLKSARQMAMRTAKGKDGVALLRKDGDVYPVPHGAAAMSEKQGNGTIEGTYSSATEAIKKMTSMTGERPAMPSVY